MINFRVLWISHFLGGKRWLKGNSSEAGNILSNLVAAGFDAVLVNWTHPQYFQAHAKKAFAKGIPVFGNHASKPINGMTADFSASTYAQGAITGDYLVNHSEPGDSFLFVYSGNVPCNIERKIGAKAVLEANKMKITQELTWTGGSDPAQYAYDMVKSTLLADTQKKIKGIWTAWEGYGIAAARAAAERGRKDILVATVDDSPRTYTEMRNLPTLHMTVSLVGKMPLIVDKMYKKLDDIFAGKPFKVQQFLFPCYIVTKDTLPPKGYYFREDGNYSGPKDFEAN